MFREYKRIWSKDNKEETGHIYCFLIAKREQKLDEEKSRKNAQTSYINVRIF